MNIQNCGGRGSKRICDYDSIYVEGGTLRSPPTPPPPPQKKNYFSAKYKVLVYNFVLNLSTLIFSHLRRPEVPGP